MRTITKFLLMLVLIFLLAGCSATQTDEKGVVDKNGAGKTETAEQTQAVKTANDERKVINFKLNDLNGKTHSLSDYQGKKVYIEYWASWCPVCISGIGEFETLAQSYEKSSDVIVLSMVASGAFGEKSSADFTRWFAERGYKFPVLLDEGGLMARQFGVRAFPTSLYIGSDGALVAAVPGQYPNTSIKARIAAMK
jgi:thiol-disulfide isomerase/thioredoxin